jgi:hypothetical protein
VLILRPHIGARGDEEDSEGEQAQKKTRVQVTVQKIRHVHDDLSKPSGLVAGSKLFRAAHPFNIFALMLEQGVRLRPCRSRGRAKPEAFLRNA